MLSWVRNEGARQYAWTSLWFLCFFCPIYGYTNYQSTQALQVYGFSFAWERSIPFVPWMIVPYLSLNLLTLSPVFFMTAPEVRRLGRAMALATVLAAPVFYFFPAPIAFTRPESVPLWDPLFQLLWALDNTGNTLPSMHITFSSITVILLWPKLSTMQRRGFALWYGLISLAVLFTWQHHVLDIFSGMALGWLCCRVVAQPTEEGFAWRP